MKKLFLGLLALVAGFTIVIAGEKTPDITPYGLPTIGSSGLIEQGSSKLGSKNVNESLFGIDKCVGYVDANTIGYVDCGGGGGTGNFIFDGDTVRKDTDAQMVLFQNANNKSIVFKVVDEGVEGIALTIDTEIYPGTSLIIPNSVMLVQPSDNANWIALTNYGGYGPTGLEYKTELLDPFVSNNGMTSKFELEYSANTFQFVKKGFLGDHRESKLTTTMEPVNAAVTFETHAYDAGENTIPSVLVFKSNSSEVVRIAENTNSFGITTAQKNFVVQSGHGFTSSNAAPTHDQELVNKKYVDDNSGSTGNFIFDANTIRNDTAATSTIFVNSNNQDLVLKGVKNDVDANFVEFTHDYLDLGLGLSAMKLYSEMFFIQPGASNWSWTQKYDGTGRFALDFLNTDEHGASYLVEDAGSGIMRHIVEAREADALKWHLYHAFNVNTGVVTSSSDGTWNITATGTITGGTFSGNGSSLTSVDSTTLDGLNSTQFLRSDQDGTLSGNLNVGDLVVTGTCTGCGGADLGNYIVSTDTIQHNTAADAVIKNIGENNNIYIKATGSATEATFMNFSPTLDWGGALNAIPNTELSVMTTMYNADRSVMFIASNIDGEGRYETNAMTRATNDKIGVTFIPVNNNIGSFQENAELGTGEKLNFSRTYRPAENKIVWNFDDDNVLHPYMEIGTRNQVVVKIMENANYYGYSIQNQYPSFVCLSGRCHTSTNAAPATDTELVNKKYVDDGDASIDAITLDGLNSTQFLRSDQASTLGGNVEVAGFSLLNANTTDTLFCQSNGKFKADGSDNDATGSVLWDVTDKTFVSKLLLNNTNQDLDVVHSCQIPKHFADFNGTNVISVSAKVSDADNSILEIVGVYDSTGTLLAPAAGINTNSTSLTTLNIPATDVSGGTFTAGSKFFVVLRCTGDNTNYCSVDDEQVKAQIKLQGE